MPLMQLQDLRKNFDIKFSFDISRNDNRDNRDHRVNRQNILEIKRFKKDLQKVSQVLFSKEVLSGYKEKQKDIRRFLKEDNNRIDHTDIDIEVTCRKTGAKDTAYFISSNSNVYNMAEIKKMAKKLIRNIREDIKSRPVKLTARDNLRRFKNSMKPMSTKKTYIGLEVECFGVEQNLNERALNKTWYRTDRDSSIEEFDDCQEYCDECESDSCGCFEGNTDMELVVLTNPKKLENDCNAISEALKYHDVNQTCGLHVHLDVRNCTGRESGLVYTNLVNSYYAFLKGMIPSSRRDDANYCEANGTSCIDSQLDNDGRYYAVNVQSIGVHNTIEVRCHSGTTNGTKIHNWALILNSIADYKGYIDRNDSIRTIAVKIGLSNNMVDYIEDRIGKF